MTPFYDAEKINLLINHPSVSRFTTLGSGPLDFSDIIKSGKAIFLGEEDGGFLYHDEGGGIWSVHTQFLPKSRGHMVVVKAINSLRYMFVNTDCIAVSTFVCFDNPKAKELALAVGFVKTADGECYGSAGEHFMLNIKEWVMSWSH